MNVKWWHILIFVAVVLAVAAILHPTKLRMGWMYLHSGNAYEAITKLKAAYDNDPSDYRALKAYANALESAGMIDEAEEAYARLIEIKPREDHFQEVARFYSWMDDPAKRKEIFRKWYEYRNSMEEGFRDEEGIRILNNLYAHYLMDQQYDDALAILKELRMVDVANRARINNDLITLYERTGDVENTMTHLDLVLEEDPENQYALEKLVQLAMLADRKGEAEKHLIRNVERHPKDDKAWQRLINFETSVKDFDAGRTWYLRWLAARPGDKKLRKNYIEWLLWTEQQKEAIAFIEKLPKDERDAPELQKQLIDLYEWNRETGKLLPIYRARFRANPRDRDNAQKLVWLLYDNKQFDELEKVLMKLTELFPAAKEYAKELADLQNLKKDEAGAIRTLERAAQATDDNEILKRLGEQYLWSSGQERTAAPKKDEKVGKTKEILRAQ